MKTFRNVLLFLLVTVLGCGQQLVEFPLDTAPTVSLTNPPDTATGVGTNIKVSAAFSKAMDAATLTAATFTLTRAGAPVPATVTYAGTTATLTPMGTLATGTLFTATITTGATDYLGNALANNYVWSFTTSDGPDTVPPTVSFTNPTDNAAAVATNTKISAAFSEAMDPTTLNSSTFKLMQGATPVPGAVTYAAPFATFLPMSALATNAIFTATITAGAKDQGGNALAADYVWTFSTGNGPDTTPPTVNLTNPTDQASSVATSTKVSAAFSEAMDAATINGSTFTLMQGATPVPGAVTYAGVTATFAPTTALAINGTFTATITSVARDLAGNALAADYVWTFSTSDAPDTTLPTVSFTSPADQASAVATNTKISAAFSEAMNAATLNSATFTVMQGAVPVPGVVTYAGVTATFTPTTALATKATFTATITNAAKDTSGNALAANYVWSFTTSDVLDVTPPLVTFTDPADLAKGVSVNTAIHVAFNEPMDCATLNAATLTLTHGGLPVPGQVTCAGPNVTLTPTSPLSGDPTYTATVTTGAKDLAGNALVMDHVWSFQTGQPAGESPVNLGAASPYAILAFNTVTNVNNPGTIVTGNLGISPGAALVGFPPGQVVGVIHAGDPIAAAAKASLLAAYNDAAGRLGAAVLAGDLSGLTFAPGLYKNSTSVMISVGNLTLDAQGDANAVFIFQMGSTLTTSAGTQVILAGGAKATNIYWAVGTSATLGTNSSFKGTLLVASAITMKTGASIEGRLLAQGAAVALDTNAITVPAP